MTTTDDRSTAPAASGNRAALILSWLAVGVPLVWGVAQTIKRAIAIFGV